MNRTANATATLVAMLVSACTHSSSTTEPLHVQRTAVRVAVQGAPDPAAAMARWSNGPPTDPDWFPVAVWLQAPHNAQAYLDAGVNTYVGLWQGPTVEQLEALEAVGMKVICDQNEVGLAWQGGAIIGWLQQDEPDNAQPTVNDAGEQTGYGPPVPPAAVVARYEAMRDADPTRPVLLNLGQGVANDDWVGRGAGATLADYETYVHGGDIVSFDVYPVAGLNRADGENYLWYVAKGLDRLRQWKSADTILWNVIETSRISAPRRATVAEVKAMVWMSLIHGSQGIIYFVHQFAPEFVEATWLQDPEMLAGVTTINRQIHALAPVLNSASIDDAVTVRSADAEVPVDVMVKHHRGDAYVFAVGMRNGATEATFRLPGLAADMAIEVLGEDRTLTSEAGGWTDTFEPYAVHLYRLPGAAD